MQGPLKAYDFDVLPMELATTEDEAADIARKIGSPVVLKIVSPDILHKSDARGVLVNLSTEKEIREGFNKIVKNAYEYKKDAKIHGVLVQKKWLQGV